MIIDSVNRGKRVLCVSMQANWISHGTHANTIDAIYGKCVSPLLFIVLFFALYIEQIMFLHSFCIDLIAMFVCTEHTLGYITE